MDPCAATGGAGSIVPVVAFLSALGAVFAAAALGKWLDPATKPDELKEMMQPLPASETRFREV